MKLNLFHLNTQFVLRSKRRPYRLQKPISQYCTGQFSSVTSPASLTYCCYQKDKGVKPGNHLKATLFRKFGRLKKSIFTFGIGKWQLFVVMYIQTTCTLLEYSKIVECYTWWYLNCLALNSVHDQSVRVNAKSDKLVKIPSFQCLLQEMGKGNCDVMALQAEERVAFTCENKTQLSTSSSASSSSSSSSRILSHDRSIGSSKASSQHSAIQCFLFQFTVFLTSLRSSGCCLHLPPRLTIISVFQ